MRISQALLLSVLLSALEIKATAAHDSHFRSFLDDHFGPLSYDTPQSSRFVVQGDSYDSGDEFTNIPDKNYLDDLDPYGPLPGPSYAGIVTFGHLPVLQCFSKPSISQDKFDVAIVGAPFDTSTSYRPGARFGPSGIREGSRRMFSGSSVYRPTFDPYEELKFVECGDVPMSPFDNRYALDQLYRGHLAILNHTTELSEDPTPRIITLGGDHTITFSALRAAYEKHGSVAVLHFDSHIDTWLPEVLGGNVTSYAGLNHGTFLHYAFEKGYITPNASMHVGIRAPFINRKKDGKNDKRCGFDTILARDIDEIGTKGIIKQVKEKIGNSKVYM